MNSSIKPMDINSEKISRKKNLSNLIIVVSVIFSITAFVILILAYFCIIPAYYSVASTLSLGLFWIPSFSSGLLVISNAIASRRKNIGIAILLFIFIIIGGAILISLFKPFGVQTYNHFLNIQQLILGVLFLVIPYLIIIQSRKIFAVVLGVFVVSLIILVINPVYGYTGEKKYNSCKYDRIRELESEQSNMFISN